eukprot:NODE_11336_length_465_cov_18.911243_g11313_i0.p1 GENE.NODE_11336_length_465_cov_18.911243_g11313_i0~~NODE_11336_length_465_cov_18.911243_g11313_i0.p1  ORF type:complete len:136 (-),score=19.27 NODE_11336_length_465_cov_18.911243_g11313_i0:56-418(-)
MANSSAADAHWKQEQVKEFTSAFESHFTREFCEHFLTAVRARSAVLLGKSAGRNDEVSTLVGTLIGQLREVKAATGHQFWETKESDRVLKPVPPPPDLQLEDFTIEATTSSGVVHKIPTG